MFSFFDSPGSTFFASVRRDVLRGFCARRKFLIQLTLIDELLFDRASFCLRDFIPFRVGRGGASREINGGEVARDVPANSSFIRLLLI